jgi:hypothetical protein
MYLQSSGAVTEKREVNVMLMHIELVFLKAEYTLHRLMLHMREN